jgi:hypothetical protein
MQMATTDTAELRQQASAFLARTQADLKAIKALNRKVGKAHKKVRAEERKLRKRLGELIPQAPQDTPQSE